MLVELDSIRCWRPRRLTRDLCIRTQADPLVPLRLPSALGPPEMGRGKRVRRPNTRLQWDPEGPAPLSTGGNSTAPTAHAAGAPPIPAGNDNTITPRIELPSPFRIPPNQFGLYRVYSEKPDTQPEDGLNLDDFADHGSDAPSSLPTPNPTPIPSSTIESLSPHPLINQSVLMLFKWFTNSHSLSQARFQTLIDDVITHPAFNVHDIVGMNAHSIGHKLDQIDCNVNHANYTGENWRHSTLKVKIPKLKPGFSRGAPGAGDFLEFLVPGLQHRSIMAIIRASFAQAKDFCYVPYKQMWQSPTPLLPGHEERIFDELYSCDAWLEEHARISSAPPIILPDGKGTCKLPRAIAGLMFWSDATHLAQFGTAKMWPWYMYFGNESKWCRGKPSARACHHIAYFLSVSFNY